MSDLLYILLSGFCILLNIVPLIWQAQHRNSGPVCLGIWVIILNINAFVNSILWQHDAKNRAPIFCDISSKLLLAGPTGLFAANLCIVRFLAQVMSPHATTISHRDRRIREIFDYSFSFGLPLFIMATHILYQPWRFGIAKAIGCRAAIANVWPLYPFWLIWPPILGLAGSLYGSYVIWRLLAHRRDFRKFVATADSALTTSRFIRLGLLSIVYLFLALPLSIYSFIFSQRAAGAYVNYNWEFVHEGLYRGVVFYMPFTERASFADYFNVIAGVLNLIFFGFGNEAGSLYLRFAQLLGLVSVYRRASKSLNHAAGNILNHASRHTDHSQYHGSAEKNALYQGPFDSLDTQTAHAKQGQCFVIKIEQQQNLANS